MKRTFDPPEHVLHPATFAVPPSVALSASTDIGVNGVAGLPVVCVGTGAGGGAPGGAGTTGAAATPPDGRADAFAAADLPGWPEPAGEPGTEPLSGFGWPLSVAAPAGVPPPSGICPFAPRGSNWDTPTTMRTTTILAATRSDGSTTPPPLRLIRKRRRCPRYPSASSATTA